MATIDEVVLHTASKDEFIRKMMMAMILATKSSNDIPKGEDYEYLRIFEDFSDAIRDTSRDLTALLRKVCAWAVPEKHLNFSDDITEPRFYEQITDIVDILLARADKQMSVVMDSTVGSDLAAAARDSAALDKDRLLQQVIDGIEKPQKQFQTEIDNDRLRAFVPRLKEKYHAKEPYKPVERSCDVLETEGLVAPSHYLPHPYEAELRGLHADDCIRVEEARALVKPLLPSPTTPFQYVETPAQFKSMLKELKKPEVREVAVDLEHHAMRSFQGLTCVMQLTTRSKDYVVDALALRSLLCELGCVFANPAVVKVFHGCERDILWLQKDLGLYVVNCFDTHCAAKELKYPALSLAHLIQYHCGVTVNKKHQLADWRQRPLPEDMVEYARLDTHYLLYVYDSMRRELLLTGDVRGLEMVFDASKKLCMGRYEKPPFNPLGYQALIVPSVLATLGASEVATLAALWDWRDKTARDMDEGVQYVMSNSELVRIGSALPAAAAQSSRADDAAVRGTLKIALEKSGPITEITRANAADIVDCVLNTLAVAPLMKSAMASGYSSVRSSGSSTGAGKFRPKVLPYATVHSFTPAVLPSAAESSSAALTAAASSTTERASSSALDDKPSQLFADVGWRTPGKSTQHGEIYSFSPFSFEGLRGTDANISEDNKQRLSRSKEDVSLAVASRTKFDSCLNELSSSTGGLLGSGSWARGSLESTVEGELSAGGGDESVGASAEFPSGLENELMSRGMGSRSPVKIDVNGNLLEVPKSLSQIYELSQRNRFRNKEKRGKDGVADLSANSSGSGSSRVKRSHDGVTVGEDPDATLRLIDSLSNANNKTDDVGVDSTLDFAAQIGWVADAAQAGSIKSAHLKEVAFQHQQQSGDTAAGEDPNRTVGGTSSTTRQSADKLMRSSIESDKSVSSNTAKAGGKQQSFDYSRYDAAVGSVSALSTSATNINVGGGINTSLHSSNRSSGSSSGKAKNKYGKPKAESSKNPYLHGGSLKNMMTQNDD